MKNLPSQVALYLSLRSLISMGGGGGGGGVTTVQRKHHSKSLFSFSFRLLQGPMAGPIKWAEPETQREAAVHT